MHLFIFIFSICVTTTGGPCEEGQKCDSILDQLEEIDDEADEHGIHLVTTEEVELAKRYGIKTFPTLAFFRNQDPLIYKGELKIKHLKSYPSHICTCIYFSRNR